MFVGEERPRSCSRAETRPERCAAGACDRRRAAGQASCGPAGDGDVRPTSDRVREAIFDVLGAWSTSTADASPTFSPGAAPWGSRPLPGRGVGRLRRRLTAAAVGAIRANLAALGIDGPGRASCREDVAAISRPCASEFDLASATRRTPSSLGRPARPVCRRRRWRCSSPVVAVEVPAEWEVSRHERYGGTLVTVVRSLGAP